MQSAMLPPYTVNEKLVKDIQADSVAQVSLLLRKHQQQHQQQQQQQPQQQQQQQQPAPHSLIGAYFLHDCQQSRLDLGPLSGFVRPPVTLVLTPLGFAVLFDSARVARYLLGQRASPADRAFLADRPAAGGKARVVELPTAGLALPGRDMFNLLGGFGLDPNAPLPLRLRCCGGGCGGPVDELAPGFWHLLWRCWAPMRDCDALTRTTDLLLRAGADANAGLAGLAVLREAFFFDGQQFEDRATALKAARYLRLLLLAGCQPERLGRPEDIAGVLCAVWRSLRRPPLPQQQQLQQLQQQPQNPMDEEAEALCYSLTDCLLACWPALAARLLPLVQLHQHLLLLPPDLCQRHAFDVSGGASCCHRLLPLPHPPPPSLRVSAALAVRACIGGRHFLRRLCSLAPGRLATDLRLLVRWPTPSAARLVHRHRHQRKVQSGSAVAAAAAAAPL